MLNNKKKKTTKSSNKNSLKSIIDKKKKEAKAKKTKKEIKKKIDRGVKVVKDNSKMALDSLSGFKATANDKIKIATKELSKASKVVKKKAKEYLDIGTIQAKNLMINNKINKSYEKVGSIVYKEKINIDNDEIKKLLNEINQLKLELKNLSKENQGE